MKLQMRTILVGLLGGLSLASCQSLPDQGMAKQARNVILFIGDGMGVSTVTAARIFVGQNHGGSGEEYTLPFERFPYLALVKTYNSNQQVPDSAGTASAMHTGVKTRAGVIGIGPEAPRGDCEAALRNRLDTLGELAVAKGKVVGIVTTTRITHATPATVYAHSPERNWEANTNIPEEQRLAGCIDIAAQLLGFPFTVALGGGRRNFVGPDQGGRRTEPEANLIADWQSHSGGLFISRADELASADKNKPLLGLFADDHLSYMARRDANTPEPTLTQMTLAALGRLSGDKDGYYLMVEGGRIDHGHHQGIAGLALTEVEEFARTIEATVKRVDLRNTLILVTADHSHVFTIAGYPTRGNPILGLVHGNDPHGNPKPGPELAQDGQPYTTLGYGNGPGAVTLPRPHPETGLEAKQQVLFSPKKGHWSETHGGEDVALYGHGPGAHRVRGVIEQNRIFDIISQAFGWDDDSRGSYQ